MRAAVADAILEAARIDERVVFVGSDLGEGAMAPFAEEFPDRFFMEGVAEQYIMGMAAGLASEGCVPFVMSIATFITRRCLEQITLDVGFEGLPVRIIGNGSGLAYSALGPTHVAVDDIALMRAIGRIRVFAPGDDDEARALVGQSLSEPGPVYLRLGPSGPPLPHPMDRLAPAGGRVLKPGRDVLVISCGVMSAVALAAAEIAARHGADVAVLHVAQVHPLELDHLISELPATPLVVTVEEHSVIGGLGSAVAEHLAEHGAGSRLVRVGLPAGVISTNGTPAKARARWGLDAERVAEHILEGWRIAT